MDFTGQAAQLGVERERARRPGLPSGHARARAGPKSRACSRAEPRKRRRSSASIATSWIGPSWRSKPKRVSLRSLRPARTPRCPGAARRARGPRRASARPPRESDDNGRAHPGLAEPTNAARGCCQRPTGRPSNKPRELGSTVSPASSRCASCFAPRDGPPSPTWRMQLTCSVSSSVHSDAPRSGANAISIAQLRLDRDAPADRLEKLRRPEHLSRERQLWQAKQILCLLHEAGGGLRASRELESKRPQQLRRCDEQRGAGRVHVGAAAPDRLQGTLSCVLANPRENAALGPLTLGEQVLEGAKLDKRRLMRSCLSRRAWRLAIAVCLTRHWFRSLDFAQRPAAPPVYPCIDKDRAGLKRWSGDRRAKRQLPRTCLRSPAPLAHRRLWSGASIARGSHRPARSPRRGPRKDPTWRRGAGHAAPG